jgi:hypothetical protein
MSDRTCFHKVARILYRFLRALYVSVIFYLVPFCVFYIQYKFAVGLQKEEGELPAKEE